MSRSSASPLSVAVMALLLVACSSPGVSRVAVAEVRQITQSPQCGLAGPGVAYADSRAALERLLAGGGQTIATVALRQTDFGREHLAFVSLGQKPSAGFAVRLDRAQSDAGEGVLELAMAVTAPGPGTMSAQVITTPCAVVAVPAAGWRRLEVTGLASKPLVHTLAN